VVFDSYQPTAGLRRADAADDLGSDLSSLIWLPTGLQGDLRQALVVLR